MKGLRLLEKARRNPASLRFSELCGLAEAFGFRFDRQRGSHAFYVNPRIKAVMNFQERKGMAKAYQVRQLLSSIDRHGLEMED